MTVGELLQRVSSSEISEWMALWEIRAAETDLARLKAKNQAQSSDLGTMG